MDARLAAVKLGDGFSIADSALGRSSVASVTTAGVTQFSEVSLINDSSYFLLRSILIPIFHSQDLIDRELGDVDIGMGHVAMETSQSKINELHRASRRGDLEEVKRLVEEKKLNPLEKGGKYGLNALHFAAVGGHLGVMKYFIERGYNPASESTGGWTCLHLAAQLDHYDLVQYLVDEHKMDPMCQTKLGSTPLHFACVGGSTSVVTYLVNAMSKYLPIEDVLRCKDDHGRSPLHLAAFCGKLEIIKLLITKFNSDPLMTNDKGRIALHYAAKQGHLHIVKFFVEQIKCNPSHMDKDKWTPLHLAALRGHLDIVKYLTLEQRCDPLCTAKDNDTPLHMAAAIRDQLEVVKFFIETLHCPPDIRGRYNLTPLEWARIRGRHQVVEYLESIRKQTMT